MPSRFFHLVPGGFLRPEIRNGGGHDQNVGFDGFTQDGFIHLPGSFRFDHACAHRRR